MYIINFFIMTTYNIPIQQILVYTYFSFRLAKIISNNCYALNEQSIILYRIFFVGSGPGSKKFPSKPFSVFTKLFCFGRIDPWVDAINEVVKEELGLCHVVVGSQGNEE